MTEQEPQAAGCAEAGDLVLVADCGAEVNVVDPDPARPTTRSLPPEASKTSRPTLAPDLTMSASQSEILARSSSGERP